MNKPHILLISRNLPPLIGGMERLLQHCVKALTKNYSLTVIGPIGCSQHLSEDIKVIEVPASINKFMLLSLYRAIQETRSTPFKLIIGGSGLTAPNLYLIQSVFKIPAISLVHGLDIVVNSFIYSRIFLPSLRRLNGIIANSKNTRKLCIEHNIDRKKISIIHPGCSTNITDSITGQNSDIPAPLTLLYVGRLIPRKGLLKFLENGFELLLQQEPDAKLAIVGDSPIDSLSHQGPELQRLVKLCKEKNWSEKVTFLGKVDDITLSQQFKKSDCLIFPLVPTYGDVEGFGMVAVEAAAHGTPTVAFNEGGVSDAIEDNVSGYLVKSGDYKLFVEKILSTKENNFTEINCKNHAKKFSWENHNAQLLTYIESKL